MHHTRRTNMLHTTHCIYTPSRYHQALVHHPLVLAVQKVDLNRVAFLVQDLGVSLALRIPPPPTRQQAAAGPPAHEYRSVVLYTTNNPLDQN